VIVNEARQYFGKPNRHNDRVTYVEQEHLEQQPAETTELDELVEQEWKANVVRLAIARIEEVFQGHAIQVFKLDLEGKSTEEVSLSTGLSKTTVYTLRQRVKNPSRA